jgi:hypothetical protein
VTTTQILNEPYKGGGEVTLPTPQRTADNTSISRLTEEARRRKTQRFKILNIKNINNILLTETSFNFNRFLYRSLSICIVLRSMK